MNENSTKTKSSSSVENSGHSVQTKCTSCEEEEKLQKKDQEEVSKSLSNLEKEPLITDHVSAGASDIQTKCSTCQEEDQQKSNGEDEIETSGEDVHVQQKISEGDTIQLNRETFLSNCSNDQQTMISNHLDHARTWVNGAMEKMELLLASRMSRQGIIRIARAYTQNFGTSTRDLISNLQTIYNNLNIINSGLRRNIEYGCIDCNDTTYARTSRPLPMARDFPALRVNGVNICDTWFRCNYFSRVTTLIHEVVHTDLNFRGDMYETNENYGAFNWSFSRQNPDSYAVFIRMLYHLNSDAMGPGMRCEEEGATQQNQDPVQPKLSIGQPNDKYEVEADSVADRVVQNLDNPSSGNIFSTSTGSVQTKFNTSEEQEKEQKNNEENTSDVAAEPQQKLLGSPEQPIVNIQTKSEVAPSIQTAPSTQSKEELVEEEDKITETEEELQKKLSATANPEPPEDESVLQAKSDNVHNGVSSDLQNGLNSSKGKGSSLTNDVSNSMGSAMGTDFSNIRVHTDDHAIQMNKELGAQAFTHGNDIYFNQGKYDTNSTSGKHLLAHELTHTIQQGAAVRKKEDKSGSDNVPDIQRALPALAAPVVVWGGRYLAGKLVRWGIKKAFEEEKDMVNYGALIMKKLLEIPIDLQGKTKFAPLPHVANHIQSISLMVDWYNNNKDIAKTFGVKFKGVINNGPKLNIKFGDMGSRNGVPIRWHESTQTYEMKPHFFEINHAAFDTKKKKDTTYLGIGIDKSDSSIYGGIALLPKSLLPMAANKVSMKFLMDEERLTKLVFGNDYNKDTFTRVSYENKIDKGRLTFIVSGYYDVGGGQTMVGAFVIYNSDHAWKGNLLLDVKSLKKKELPVERDSFSSLTSVIEDMELDKTWNFNNITASLKASYYNGVLEIRGKAKYLPKKEDNSRIKSAEATLLVTNKEKAWAQVQQQLPEKEKGEPLHLPSLDKSTGELAMVGWGSVELSIVKDDKGKDFITGKGSLVVDPDGHLTVFGTVRVESRYTLMEEKGIDWEPISPKLVKEFGPFFVRIPGIPAGLNFTGKGGLYYKYMFGPLTLYDIKIAGIYSTNPDINKELSVSARLNLSASLDGKVGVTGRMAARVGTSFPYLGVDVSAVEMNVDGTASLQGYSDFELTLGTREQTITDGKVPRHFVKGKLLVAGELSLGLEGKIHFEVLYGNLADKTIKGNWPIANTGVAIDFDYNIGDEISMEKLKEIINIKKTKFERKNFVRGVLKNKMPKEKKSPLKGGFYDEKGKKISKIGDKPLPPEEPITPVKIKDDFNMEGEWHYLEVEIGAPGQDVILKMATTPQLLLEKIDDHKEEIGNALKTTTDKQEEKRLKQMLKDVKELRKNAFELIQRLIRLGIDPNESNDKGDLPGFEDLADQIATYGRKYELSDLSDPLAPPAQPSEGLGDGSFDYPIPIRWTKRSWHNPITLRPKRTAWTKKGEKAPPDEAITANMDEKTEIEIAPTQYMGNRYRSYPGQRDTEREVDGEKIKVIKIGVDSNFEPDEGKKLHRVSSRGRRRGMEGRFRTLLKNYQYDWSDMSPDHVQDLGWEGPDSVENLWPLYRDMNANIANYIYHQQVEYVEEGEIRRDSPMYMTGKWFIIDSIG
ncbi:DUF4157 domain-containing protein [Aquimarina gracilis]|uniref:DUF4157 domain-containing protein n=1 Tax=Aquimarina gracilis TaxID=874422 RepID=A0ABU5ZTW0_9FLAO|nr:DUF4157 domain-containing protein [Aquimarina gracilis]MEB3345409.1 DUF4157 domain-containing protein [Aquimarina gracilis]